MHKLMSTAAALLIFSASANGAPRVRGARPHSGPIHVQGFYRVDRFYGWPGFYHQYPSTLFGYPNYNYSYFPLYQDYPGCDFVWANPTAKHRTVQHGVWSCS